MLRRDGSLHRQDNSIRGRGPRGFLALVCLALCLTLPLTSLAAGCSRADSGDEKTAVFYLNSDRNGLVSRAVTLQSGSVPGQVQECIQYLSKDVPEKGLLAPVSGFECEEISIEEDTVVLELSGSYRDMDSITEKLTRAAIVNTLTGIEDVHSVTIRVNGALLMDERGSKSENMTADQFIYSSGNEMLNYENAELHLYFASEDGKKLVETYRTVVYNTNVPMERLVVEQIITGPKGDFNYPVVNENTKIVNIVTRDDICTVTLDRTFLANPYEVDPEVALYSIVNSLTELPSIHQVQILIDGEEAPVFMDRYVLDTETMLQKNTEIVQTRN